MGWSRFDTISQRFRFLAHDFIFSAHELKPAAHDFIFSAFELNRLHTGMGDRFSVFALAETFLVKHKGMGHRFSGFALAETFFRDTQGYGA